MIKRQFITLINTFMNILIHCNVEGGEEAVVSGEKHLGYN